MSNQKSELIEHFFRNEFGKVVSFLTSKYGVSCLGLAEDAVQEAMIQAMKTWSYKLPDKPSAWITKVANNKMIDTLRRQQKVYYSTQVPDSIYELEEISEDLFSDDMIKMLFACCNPTLSVEYQLILTLRILGGLSIKEISSALLKKEETIAKSYTRAKKKFREENVKLELPPKAEIQNRLYTVLKTIYLIFNEGYKTSTGTKIIRRELCNEAMRLNHLLLGNQETNNEWTRSLMALMHYHSARFDGRVHEDGSVIPLQFQDRSKWDQKHIHLGNQYLSTITSGTNNTYFLQAAISGIHSSAKSWANTDWKSILSLYDALYKIQPNPMVALNRVIPLSKVLGPKKALSELEKLKTEQLEEHYLYHAIKGELLAEINLNDDASKSLEVAIQLTANEEEKRFLNDKLSNLLDSTQ